MARKPTTQATRNNPPATPPAELQLGGLAELGVEVLGDMQLTPAEDARAQEAIAQAERDLAAELRTSLRWSREQVGVIRRAAAAYGMPYQTYVKQAAFRQALADLRAANAAGVKV